MRIPITLSLLGAGLLLLATSSASSAQSRSAEMTRAVDYCQYRIRAHGYPPLQLNDDRTVACFEGDIDLYLDVTPLLRLQQSGFFVMRSEGGHMMFALAMADILWEKAATVVIRDYCFSACANALFVASQRTHVLPNAIVAWHGGPATCGDQRVAAAAKRLYRDCQDYAGAFYAKRGLERNHMVVPPTNRTAKLFYQALNAAPNKTSVFWMWHPDNHRGYFKDRITYEAYPEDQFDVDKIVARVFPNIRVIYDHPSEGWQGFPPGGGKRAHLLIR